MKRIRWGMVGGGQGGFIGEVHRMAARLDDGYQLIAGALSSDPARARHSARELGIRKDRTYTDYREMAEAEARQARRHRGSHRRHAQRIASCHRVRLPRARHPCHLRQAAGDEPCRWARSRRARREGGSAPRRHL